MQPNHSYAHPRRQAGFTLVEIMVVIVILGMLAAIVGQNVLGQSAAAEVSTAKINVTNIHDAVKLYMVQNRRRLPTWEDLLERDEKGFRYLDYEDAPIDPWGNEYVITTHPEFESQPFVLSWGPDGLEGTEDDIDSDSVTRREEK